MVVVARPLFAKHGVRPPEVGLAAAAVAQCWSDAR